MPAENSFEENLTQHVSFRMGREEFTINVGDVQEILNSASLSQVPTSSKTIRGLINLRGQIIPAIDLSERLQYEGTISEQPMIVVVRDGEEIAALLVDEVGDVLSVDPSNYESLPPTLSAVLSKCSKRIIRSQSKVMLELDVKAILDFDGRDNA